MKLYGNCHVGTVSGRRDSSIYPVCVSEDLMLTTLAMRAEIRSGEDRRGF